MKHRARMFAVGAAAVVAATAVAGSASAGRHAHALTKITISYDNAAGNFLPLWVADKEGFFNRNGLDVHLVQNSNGSALLVSNNVQFSIGGGSNFIAAHAKGADLEFIGTLENNFAAVAIARPGIDSVSDLAGKKLGLSSPGALTDLEGQVMLKAFKLSPKTVQVVYISSLTARNAALLSGQIDALVGSPNVTLIQKGMKQIYDLDKFYYLSVAISASKKYVDANPTAATAVLKSLIQAVQWLRKPANRTQAAVYDQQLTGQPDPAQQVADVEHYTPTFDPRLRIANAALGNTIRYVQQSGGGFVDPKEMVDKRFLDRLVKSGWMDKTVPPTKLRVTIGKKSKVTVRASNGKVVKNLTPGRYEFDVKDSSTKVGVSMVGPNNFRKRTSAKQKGGFKWVVNLVRGNYRLNSTATTKLAARISVS